MFVAQLMPYHNCPAQIEEWRSYSPVNKLTSVFYALASWIHSYFDNVMTKFMINNRTDALKTDINLFFMISNCRIAGSRSLTHRNEF